MAAQPQETDEFGGVAVSPQTSTPQTDEFGGIPASTAAPQPQPQPAEERDEFGGIPADRIKSLAQDDKFDPAAHAAQNPEDAETAYQVYQARKNQGWGDWFKGVGRTLSTPQTYWNAGKGVANFLGGLGQAIVADPIARAYYAATGDPRQLTKQAEATIEGQHGEESAKGLVNAAIANRPGAYSGGWGEEDYSGGNDLSPEAEDARQRSIFAQRVQQAKNAQQLAQGRPLDTGVIASMYSGIHGGSPSETLSPEALAASGAPAVDTGNIERASAAGDPTMLAMAAAPALPGASYLGGRIAQGVGKVAQLPMDALESAGRKLTHLGPAGRTAAAVAGGVGALEAAPTVLHHPIIAAAAAGAKGLQVIGRAAEQQGKELATGVPSELTTNAANAAATGDSAIWNNAQRRLGNAAATGASTAVGMLPLNAALSEGDPQKFAESEVGAGAFGGTLGAFARNRPAMVEAVRPFLRQEGVRALTEAGQGNDPLAAKSQAYLMSIPEDARNHALEAIGAIQGLPTDTPNGQVRAKLYVLNDSDYRDVLAQKFGMQQAAMGGGRGFYIGDDGAAYVNGDYHSGLDPSELGHTVGHEFGGHAAVNIMQAMGAKGGQLYTGLIGAARDALMPGGRPTADFYRFVKNYNRAFDPSGQTQRLDFQNPESIEEFLAEQAGQLMAAKGAGELALPKTIQDKISDGLGRYLGKVVGVDTDKVGTPTHFGREEVGKLSKLVQDTLGQVVGMKLRGGAEIPEPAKTTQTRIDELNQTLSKPRPSAGAPLEETRAWIAEQAAARKELSQLQGSQSASFPAAGQPPVPTSAPQAPNVPATPPAPSRASVAAALRLNGIPAAEAAQWAQRAQGATLQEMILDALKQRAAQKFPSTPPVPSQPTGNQPTVLPPAAPTAPKSPEPSTVESLTREWQQSAKDKGVSHPDTRALQEQLAQAMTERAKARVQTPAPNEQPAPTPNENGALQNGGTLAPPQPATPTEAPPGARPAPAPAPSREAVETLGASAEAKALEEEHQKQLTKSGKKRSDYSLERDSVKDRIHDAKVNAILDAIGDDPNGIHKVTMPDGSEKRVGDFDPENPYHQALADLGGGLSGPALDSLTKMQDAKGQTQFIRYRSALSSAENGPELTDKGMINRRAEYAVDPPEDRTEGTIQHKAIIPVQTTMTKDGKPQSTFFVLDNLLHNAESVREFMGQHPELGEFPYKDEADLLRDAKTYADNHAHGWKGDGSGPMQRFPDSDLPAQDLNYKAETIPKDRFDVLNMMMHDEQSGKLADRTQEVADKQAKVAAAKTEKERERLQGVLDRTITRMKTSQEGYALGDLNNPWVDHQTGETNQLRAKLKAAGLDTNDALKSPFETLSPEHILDVSDKPIPMQEGDIPTVRPTGFSAGAESMAPMGKLNAKAVRAGFLPDTGAPKTAQEKARERIAAREGLPNSANGQLKPETLATWNKMIRPDEKGIPNNSEAMRIPEDHEISTDPKPEQYVPTEYKPRPKETVVSKENGVIHLAEEKGQKGYQFHRFVTDDGNAELSVMEHFPWNDRNQAYDYNTPQSARINLAFTKPEARGKGLMSKLLLAADKSFPTPLTPDYMNTPEMLGTMRKLMGQPKFMPDSTPSTGEPAPEGQQPSGSQSGRLSTGGTSQSLPQKSFWEMMDENAAKQKAEDAAITKARIDGTERYTPAIRLEDGKVVKSRSATEGHGELSSLYPEQKVEHGFVNNQTGKFMNVLEVARERGNFMPDTGKPEDGETPGERLMREAEAAGLAPSLDTIKGVLKGDNAAFEKLRAMIKSRTGKDARFMPDHREAARQRILSRQAA